MKLAKILYAVGAGVSIIATAASGQSLPADELWRLVAKSHIICIGTPNVPIEQIEQAQRSGHHEYADLQLKIERCLKADDCPKETVVRYFTQPASYKPSPQVLVNLNQKRSLLFLQRVDPKYSSEHSPKIYFAGDTPKAIQPFDDALRESVAAEVMAQRKIIADMPETFPAKDEPLFDEIHSLIEKTLQKESEMRAFRDLEALGKKGVAGMILMMDDQRELPLKEIALRNPPGVFESSRHYGPTVVAEAIAAILNQITGEHFGGDIYNGGSERERRAAIDAWRIYLYRTQLGAGDPTR